MWRKIFKFKITKGMGIIPSYLMKEVASNVAITEENGKKYVK